MSGLDNLIPNATQIRKEAALREAEKASRGMSDPGGTIKALTEKVSPRVFRVCALPAPSDRQKSQPMLEQCVDE